jgi:hypothetical protein
MMSIEELVRTLADHVGALATRVERSTLQTVRIANASEDTNALALNEVRESRAEKALILKELQEIRVLMGTIVDNVKDAENAADSAKHAIREATGAHQLLEREDKETTRVKTAGQAFRDLLNAPGRSQILILSLVVILSIAVLGYFAIRDNMHAAELEHQGAEMRHK